MSETNKAMAEIASMEAQRVKAQELVADMKVPGADNLKDPVAEGKARAKELDDVLSELNKMSTEETGKAANA